jgi:hypothetical protein
MRFQLHCKFLDDTNKQHSLPLPCVAFNLQKPLRFTLMLVGKVLVIFVAKNLLVQVCEQVIFPPLKGLNLCYYICNT